MAGAWADAAPAKSAKAATPRTRALILSSVVSGRFASPDIQRTLKVIVRPSRPCALANLVNFAAPWRGRFSFGRPERPKQASNSSTVQGGGKRRAVTICSCTPCDDYPCDNNSAGLRRCHVGSGLHRHWLSDHVHACGGGDGSSTIQLIVGPEGVQLQLASCDF